MKIRYPLIFMAVLLISLTSCFPILSQDKIQSYIDRIESLFSSVYVRRNDPTVNLAEFKEVLREKSVNITGYDDLYAVIRSALEILQDRHIELIEPSKVGGYSVIEGFGFLLVPIENIVIRVFPKSNAESVGLKVGDKILFVNGKAFVPGDSIVTSNNSLEIVVYRKRTNEKLTYKLKKRPYNLNIKPYGNIIQNKVGYLEIPGFHEDSPGVEKYSTTLQVKMQQLDAQYPICGWVLDLRRNTGGQFTPMYEGLKLILNSEKIGFLDTPKGDSMIDFNHEDINLSKSKIAQIKSKYVPIAVLQSKMTASAGEMVVVSLIGRENTRFFGEKTNGIPTHRKDFQLPDGALLSIPDAYIADRTGWRYTTSITPDQDVIMNWEYIENQDQDLVLNAALKWLHLQASCNPSKQAPPGQTPPTQTPPKLNP